jgi:hypothetical protein
MALSSELRSLLTARRTRAFKADRAVSLPATHPPLQDDRDDNIDPDDSGEANMLYITFAFPTALPPIPPAWSFLCSRGHTAVSIALAKNALESIGCYLGIRPTSNALYEAARCHSAGALRQLITDIYGQRGLDAAFALAGLQRPRPVESIQRSKARPAAEANERLTIPRSRWDTTAARRVQRWLERSEPVQSSWRASWESADQNDGAWVG